MSLCVKSVEKRRPIICIENITQNYAKLYVTLKSSASTQTASDVVFTLSIDWCQS